MNPISLSTSNQMPEVRGLQNPNSVIVSATITTAQHRLRKMLYFLVPALELQDLARPLFTNTMSFKDKSQIIDVLEKIPETERVAFIKNATCLMLNIKTSTSAKLEILKRLAHVPAKERENFTRMARLLLLANPDIHSEAILIEDLAKMSMQDREIFVLNNQIMGPNAFFDLRKYPVADLINIPVHEQNDFIKLAKILIGDEIIRQGFSSIESRLAEPLRSFQITLNILKFLTNLASHEREGLVQYIKLLMPGTEIYRVWSASQGLEIFKVLANIPAHERDIFTKQIVKLIPTNSVGYFRKFELIMGLGRLSFAERADFVKDYMQNARVNSDFLSAVVQHQENLVAEPNPKELTIDEILKREPDVILPPHLDHLHPKHKEMLKKAVRIKNYYNKMGYCCFLHSNEPIRFVLSLLMKEIAKMRNPEKFFKDPFVHFRSEQFYQTHASHKHIADRLKSTIENDMEHREEVMSVDAYFFHYGDSANRWCHGLTSACPLGASEETDLDPLLEGIPEGAAFQLKQRILNLMAIFSRDAPCGNLHVIAIPEANVMDCAYPSHPFGVYCAGMSKKDQLKELVEANHDVNPLCWHNGKTKQWRLAVAALRAENGVRSFSLDPSYSDLNAFIQEYIQPLAAHIVLCQSKAKYSARPTSQL